ncbi:MAG TPA: YoaK family protein [Candidatus Angelobacter sp.]|nr:YoaK family protein [Candidatus Angelobacter sp.]
MASQQDDSDRWLAFGLAFVGGYSDAVSFLLATTFTGHVTGNLVMVAVSLATGHLLSAARQIAAILSFVLGVWVSTLIARRWSSWTAWRFLAFVMVIEVSLMSAATGALASHYVLRMEAFLVCAALALGLQNGAFHRAGGTSVHTTYLTGVITSTIMAVTGTTPMESRGEQAPTPPGVVSTLDGIWMAFVLGAGVGAVAIFSVPRVGMMGGVLVLIALLVRGTMRARDSGI